MTQVAFADTHRNSRLRHEAVLKEEKRWMVCGVNRDGMAELLTFSFLSIGTFLGA